MRRGPLALWIWTTATSLSHTSVQWGKHVPDARLKDRELSGSIQCISTTIISVDSSSIEVGHRDNESIDFNKALIELQNREGQCREQLCNSRALQYGQELMYNAAA